jgi:anion-transporting  ArsA/GET3 family ATPase
MTIPSLLAAREVVICCGAGGVGKTTMSAAIALEAATHLGGRVLVVTVDPARRLATAMGLDGGLGNVAVQVDTARLGGAAGGHARGELWAAMLDTKASWDDLVRRHAPDRQTADRILANPLYRNITGTFVQSHDYIAMERLYELHSSGDWDLLVIDTPPSRHAIDFLDAPGRMAEFFSSRFLRLLTAPARSRWATAASRPFYQIADRVLGSQFIEDIAEFFLLFQSMYDGFVERARAVSNLLGDDRTAFVVVSTLEPVPVREAEFFLDELARRRLDLGAIVLNRVLPDWFDDPAAEARADALADADPPDTDLEGRVLTALAANYQRLRLLAQREAEERRRLGARADVVVSVPLLHTDVGDVDALARVGAALWPGQGPPARPVGPRGSRRSPSATREPERDGIPGTGK